ncbi:hypothetical protein THIOKS1260002 [Thiocapsa sp. KS1]|nr:hypothetical protein THIOKS1260002 [Thiocapsa sp. KS1]
MPRSAALRPCQCSNSATALCPKLHVDLQCTAATSRTLTAALIGRPLEDTPVRAETFGDPRLRLLPPLALARRASSPVPFPLGLKVVLFCSLY